MDGEETQVEDNMGTTEGHGREDTIPQRLSGLTFTLSSAMMEELRTIEVLEDSPEVDLITRADTVPTRSKETPVINSLLKVLFYSTVFCIFRWSQPP